MTAARLNDMNLLFYPIIVSTFISSCSESFKNIDTQSFNEKISGRVDIETPEELMIIYYDYPEVEESPKFSVQFKELKADKYEITLIHEGIEDDSQSAIKVVMLAEKTGQTWVVLKIEKNRKCWDGRGHTTWGTGLCN